MLGWPTEAAVEGTECNITTGGTGALQTQVQYLNWNLKHSCIDGVGEIGITIHGQPSLE
jgi:hypothetical protein